MDAWMDQKQWADEYTINYSLNNPCKTTVSPWLTSFKPCTDDGDLGV